MNNNFTFTQPGIWPTLRNFQSGPEYSKQYTPQIWARPFRDKRLPFSARVLLHHIVTLAGKKGSVQETSSRRLADALGVSRRHVFRLLKFLELKKYIHRRRLKRRDGFYSGLQIFIGKHILRKTKWRKSLPPPDMTSMSQYSKRDSNIEDSLEPKTKESLLNIQIMMHIRENPSSTEKLRGLIESEAHRQTAIP